jgi:hypothetical protein
MKKNKILIYEMDFFTLVNIERMIEHLDNVKKLGCTHVWLSIGPDNIINQHLRNGKKVEGLEELIKKAHKKKLKFIISRPVAETSNLVSFSSIIDRLIGMGVNGFRLEGAAKEKEYDEAIKIIRSKNPDILISLECINDSFYERYKNVVDLFAVSYLKTLTRDWEELLRVARNYAKNPNFLLELGGRNSDLVTKNIPADTIGEFLFSTISCDNVSIYNGQEIDYKSYSAMTAQDYKVGEIAPSSSLNRWKRYIRRWKKAR